MDASDPGRVRLAAGAVGSTLAELSTLPMDFAKVQLQTAGQGKSLGLLTTLRDAVTRDGPRVLWRGAVPAVTRQVAYYSVSMGLYTPLRDWQGPAQTGYADKILAGGIAGAIGISMANPYAPFKRTAQADRTSHGNARYTGMLDAGRALFAQEGARGFFRGVVPNMQRCFIVNGMEFGTYDQCKSYLVESGVSGLGATVGASLVAGFAGALASSPLDVVKTTLMSQPPDRRRSLGVLQCAQTIARTQGLRAFYKGFVPYWLREAPWCCIFFLTFEATRSALLRPSS
ncbi:hypothetical protein SDRG_01332 [Saprolegnia diclina VS20]|uniref:Uncharacterized protein n=1 Tax=Saprolegnia diclina (strain VS20) TaxID=1156394 RepID=T0S822_SAPDV|nr:hypothetical protein SDRG_01332 [Saprolegnia diclina VS20]EQC41358.1 hypothetical protein SDRG_01332 [Saprolegnia diclina VS20]|eukprot:XP_008605072.1 hypothetical protein SDRG_01332 [Saprolegnia diclina VS20]